MHNAHTLHGASFTLNIWLFHQTVIALYTGKVCFEVQLVLTSLKFTHHQRLTSMKHS